MKSLIGFISILVIGFFTAPYFPWWGAMALAAWFGFILNTHSVASFWFGALALLCLWGGMAFWTDIQNTGILSERVAQVFQVNGIGIVFITGLLGGVIGGLSSLSGNLFRKLFSSTETIVKEA